MVKAEKRLGRKFTTEEVEDGTMGALLIESDFDMEKTVSRLPFLFRLTPYLFHSHSRPKKSANNRHNWEKLALTMSRQKTRLPAKTTFLN